MSTVEITAWQDHGDPCIYHTDSVLRRHQMLVQQNTKTDKFTLVDWQSFKPVSKKREEAYWADPDVKK